MNHCSLKEDIVCIALCFLFGITVGLAVIMVSGADAKEVTLNATPPARAKEVAWTAWLAGELGGSAEYMLPDRRRVDILLDTQAIEFDWCNEKKLSEGIKQAAYYGRVTNRQPVAIYGMGRDDGKIERQILRRAVTLGSKQSPPVLVIGFSVTHPRLDVLRVQLGGQVQGWEKNQPIATGKGQ